MARIKGMRGDIPPRISGISRSRIRILGNHSTKPSALQIQRQCAERMAWLPGDDFAQIIDGDNRTLTGLRPPTSSVSKRPYSRRFNQPQGAQRSQRMGSATMSAAKPRPPAGLPVSGRLSAHTPWREPLRRFRLLPDPSNRLRTASTERCPPSLHLSHQLKLGLFRKCSQIGVIPDLRRKTFTPCQFAPGRFAFGRFIFEPNAFIIDKCVIRLPRLRQAQGVALEYVWIAGQSETGLLRHPAEGTGIGRHRIDPRNALE